MRALGVVVLLVGGLMLPAAAVAEDEKKPESFGEIVGYAFGMHFMRNLGELGVLDDIDVDMVVQAIRDMSEGKEPKLTDDEGQEAFRQLQAMIQARGEAQAEERSKAATERGATFLAENGKKDGVVTTESGLQYKVKTAVGEGPSPTLEDSVLAHYTGTLLDGTKFDSSRDRGAPAEFPVTGVIKGWTEVLQLMKVGETYDVWIPSELAYGERGAGQDIGPNETLYFEIELVEIR